ncbi:alpha-2,8-sialyltransferase 8F-like [Trematomus bernacchii]|uniref:alpha-2,8-sialyltransferase 8F-like n=1 Tax=Trematomus bernacchii TaxID=40690 RepID=UPI00146DC473|nr:alpha-2,8-sialyltransferase 8F-like [Trematomus bernacchii]
MIAFLSCWLHSNIVTHGPPSPKKIPRWPSDLCAGCRALIKKVRGVYSKPWKKQEDNCQKLRSQLRSECHGFDRAIITQANTPVGSKILFSLEGKKTLRVTPEIFSTFSKENLFQNKKWDTCAVVGNSGILSNSSCGEMIDSAQFVIRCNLPALGKGYEKDVGMKTDIVTANPSIIYKKYGDLERRRRPFVESLRIYGKSRLLLPAFTFARDVPRSLRAAYTAEDFESPMWPVFLNPDYRRNLTLFWRSRGQRKGALSTGFNMVSLALEHCANVHLYGFWPFSIHPFELNAVNNHYFDNNKVSWKLHAMPYEFNLWLQLHIQGVLRLHLGKCQPGTN